MKWEYTEFWYMWLTAASSGYSLLLLCHSSVASIEITGHLAQVFVVSMRLPEALGLTTLSHVSLYFLSDSRWCARSLISWIFNFLCIPRTSALLHVSRRHFMDSWVKVYFVWPSFSGPWKQIRHCGERVPLSERLGREEASRPPWGLASLSSNARLRGRGSEP